MTKEEKNKNRNNGVQNVSLQLNEIYPHPDNPRKDLGDLSELAESIRKNGIMQNLTVFSGHWENGEWFDGGYTLLIGHRRCAAAKEAGLTEVPCKIVSGLEHREQVGIMLEENMQRNDLTIIEQANGFQMMLDLGETVDGITKKTGFSESTVRHRLNIAKLDQKLLETKQDDKCFQLSISNLIDLERIKSIETRNKVLASARTSRELEWRITREVKEEQILEKLKSFVQFAESNGVEKAPIKAAHELFTGEWEIVQHLNLMEKDVPKKFSHKDEKELYWVRAGDWFKIVKKIPERKKETSEEGIVNQKMIKTRKMIEERIRDLEKERHDFISHVISGSAKNIKNRSQIMEDVWRFLAKNGAAMYGSELRGFFTGKHDYDCTKEERDDAMERFVSLDILYQMMIVLHITIGSRSTVNYFCKYDDDVGKMHLEGYEILAEFGWTFPSIDDYKILNGTADEYEK